MPQLGALVVGEALVDIVTLPDGRVTEHPGGSPANVAVALARLGRPTTFVTQLADDDYGRLLQAHLRGEGVDLRAEPPAGGRTSSARATLGPGGAAAYDFDVSWDLAAAVPVQPATVVHVGSLGALLAPGADSVLATLEAYAGRATLSYDLNLRPETLGGIEAFADRVTKVVGACDLVKASDEDLAHLHPRLEPAAAAHHLLALGPAAVVVTLGARGALCVTREAEILVPSLTVDVVDTIGAGDAFSAGLIDALWEAGHLGDGSRAALRALGAAAWTDVLRHAVAVAAVTVTRAGADAPSRADLSAVSELTDRS
jgi:fructokinase